MDIEFDKKLINDRSQLMDCSFDGKTLVTKLGSCSVSHKLSDSKYIVSDRSTLKFLRVFDTCVKLYNINEQSREENNFKDYSDDEIFDMLKKYSFVLTINDDKFNVFKKTSESYMGFCPKRFDGLPDKNGPTSCCNNHLRILKIAKENNYPFVLVFEDDAVGKTDAVSKLIKYIKNIPVDCGVLALGGTGYCGMPQNRFSIDPDGMFQLLLRGIVWGSQSYICFRRAYDYSIDNLTRDKIVDFSLFHLQRNLNYRLSEELYCQVLCEGFSYIHNRSYRRKEDSYYVHHEKLNRFSMYNNSAPGFAKIVH